MTAVFVDKYNSSQVIANSFTGVGASAALKPIAGRGFNITISGTFVGTIKLFRSFDGGTTWFPMTNNGSGVFSWTAPCSETASDPEASVQYRLGMTAFTSGTAVYRLSQ